MARCVSALTSAMGEMIRGSAQAWPKVERYVSEAIACEFTLANQEWRASEYPG